jgi:hypothetical protein
MKKRLVEVLIFQFTVIIMGVLGGLYSLIFAGVAGGTALGLAPKFNFELVGRYVCPEGAQLQYESGQNTASGTPDNSYSVNCVSQDGTVIQGMKPRAISSVIGMYFLLCFIPTYLPGAILLWIFLNREFPRFFDENPAPVDDEEEDAVVG